MAILKLEDLGATVEILVFPNTYKQVYTNLIANSVVAVRGRLSLKEESPKILASNVTPIDDAYRTITSINIDLCGLQREYPQCA